MKEEIVGSIEKVKEIYLHDDLRLSNVSSNTLVRQDRATIDINLILDGNIVTKNGASFQAGPSANA
jgi:hypothetical protein